MTERFLNDAVVQTAFPIVEVPMQDQTKYTVKLYAGEPDPVLTLTTYGGWNVEGVFICVYAAGLKQGFRIPPGCYFIETTEAVEAPAKPDPLTDPIDVDPETETIISRLAKPVADETTIDQFALAYADATKPPEEVQDGSATIAE